MTNVTIMATRPEHNLPLYKAANKATFYSPPVPAGDLVAYLGVHLCGAYCKDDDVSINKPSLLSFNIY